MSKRGHARCAECVRLAAQGCAYSGLTTSDPSDAPPESFLHRSGDMQRRPVGFISAVFLLVFASSVLRGQTRGTASADAGRVFRLGAPDATLADEFSIISSVRELADGRVLVSDEKEKRLALGDFRSRSVTTLGGQGAGPGEYRQVARLWAAAGDSTLHKEPYGRRLIVLHGGQIIRTVGAADSSLRSLPTTPLLGADGRGRMVMATMPRVAQGRLLPDSVHLIRLDRAASRVDTIARLQSAQGWGVAAGVSTASMQPIPAGGRSASVKASYVMSVHAPDQIAVFTDGWIAIARTNPYRVDWCAPGQRCRPGPVILAAQPRMTDREKQAYLDAAAKTHGWPPTSDIAETAGWPRVMPPFAQRPSRVDAGALFAMPDGSVLIERLPSADAMWMRYDIVPRSEAVAGQVQLPLGEQIVGLGRASVYVAVTDPDGLQRLRRHPWSFSAEKRM